MIKKFLLLTAVTCFYFIANAQFDKEPIDNILLQNKKLLGNEAVLMLYKDGKIIYKSR